MAMCLLEGRKKKGAAAAVVSSRHTLCPLPPPTHLPTRQQGNKEQRVAGRVLGKEEGVWDRRPSRDVYEAEEGVD